MTGHSLTQIGAIQTRQSGLRNSRRGRRVRAGVEETQLFELVAGTKDIDEQHAFVK